MKRFHLHIAVADLQQSIDFYSKLFSQSPTVERADYAKWLLEDPRLNFAISARGHKIGVNHLGFQAENDSELADLRQQAEQAAGEAVLEQGNTTCCYANSTKHWTIDPSGLAWEHYLTMGESQHFGVEPEALNAPACCIPLAAINAPQESCCVPNNVNDQTTCCSS